MWLARWFGGRKAEADDEPARFAPPAPPVQPVNAAQAIGSAKRGIHAHGPAQRPAGHATSKAKSGFDPYNSGSFERKNAWERVIRR